MKNIKTVIGALVLLIIAGLAGVWLWHKQSVSTNQSDHVIINSPTNSSANAANVNQGVPVYYVPRVMASNWQDYGVENDVFYLNQAGAHQNIVTPFKMAEYHWDRTPYGFLFWKKGAMKKTLSTSAYGSEPYLIEYENGVNPEFHWYDLTTQTFVALPPVTLENKDRFFERVYAVHFSSSEPKLLIEIGSYDNQSAVFTPGLVDDQPLQTHGMVYSIVANTFSSSPDPLTIYLSALQATSTLGRGLYWDSANQVAVGVPGGEGCGAYDTLEFVDLKDIRVAIAGGEGSFDYAKDMCNPENAVSSDNRWFILSGKTTGGKDEGLLFTAENGAAPIKRVSATPGDLADRNWDLTGAYPVYGLGNFVYDFTK